MADWQKIKTEYITTDTSYRELSQKYGVHYTNIAKKAKKEDWQQLRQQQANTTQTKMIQAVEKGKVDRAARLMTVADKLLQKVEVYVDDHEFVTPTSAKNIADALKGIKEVCMVRSLEDIEEQKARIAKLQKESQKEEIDAEIKVIIGGDLEAYSK